MPLNLGLRSWFIARQTTSDWLKIIGKLATILGVEPAEFFPRPFRVQIPKEGRLNPMPSSAVS